MDVHPLYAAYTDAKAAKASADANFEAAKANLLAALPPGEVRSVVASLPPSVQNVGGEIVEVPHTFLGS